MNHSLNTYIYIKEKYNTTVSKTLYLSRNSEYPFVNNNKCFGILLTLFERNNCLLTMCPEFHTSWVFHVILSSEFITGL